jgi:hypothetical protein
LKCARQLLLAREGVYRNYHNVLTFYIPIQILALYIVHLGGYKGVLSLPTVQFVAITVISNLIGSIILAQMDLEAEVTSLQANFSVWKPKIFFKFVILSLVIT